MSFLFWFGPVFLLSNRLVLFSFEGGGGFLGFVGGGVWFLGGGGVYFCFLWEGVFLRPLCFFVWGEVFFFFSL